MNASAAARIRLTDAQLIIAREYGFTDIDGRQPPPFRMRSAE